jgi:hypothetical protein
VRRTFASSTKKQDEREKIDVLDVMVHHLPGSAKATSHQLDEPGYSKRTAGPAVPLRAGTSGWLTVVPYLSV